MYLIVVNLSVVVFPLVCFVMEYDVASLKGSSFYVQAERGSEFASACDRDRMAQWLSMLTRELQYKQEVYYRATSLLDAFLSSKKACCLVCLCIHILTLHL